MRTLILMALVLAACGPLPKVPAAGTCTEFDHSTIRGGKQVVCRMAWCDNPTHWAHGGPATLWCEEKP